MEGFGEAEKEREKQFRDGILLVFKWTWGL